MLSTATARFLEIPAQLDVRVSTRANDAVIGESGREVNFHLSDFHIGDMGPDPPLIKSLITQHGHFRTEINLLAAGDVEAELFSGPIGLECRRIFPFAVAHKAGGWRQIGISPTLDPA